MKIAVAISGASGVMLGFRFIEHLPGEHEVFLIISSGAKEVIKHELSSDLIVKKDRLEIKDKLIIKRQITIFEDNNLSAPISSGSFKFDSFALIPASMDILAKIACGISDTLIARVAHICLKERRDFLIAPREMPFSSINLENMLKLSNLGAIIAPPAFGYYAKSRDIKDLEKFLVGRWMDFLKIENSLFKRWGEN